jgi:hypothetical protein
MTFIAPDEFIVLMDFPNMLSQDDLLRIREAGVRTIYGYVSWQQVEQTPGVYDWAQPDAWVARAAAADMRLLVRCYENAPPCFPADWYLQAADGTAWYQLPQWGSAFTFISPWCAEAVAAEQAFLRACQARYGGERVLCFPGVVHDGEMLLPATFASWYDPHAQASFRAYAGTAEALVDLRTPADMVARPAQAAWLAESLYRHVAAQQAVFPEIWLSLVERDSGNWLMRHLCADLPAALGKELNLLLFEVYRDGGMQGALDNVQGYVDRVWTGSQFCEGLMRNTATSIAHGLRGFLTAPLHTDLRPGHLEPWMLDALRWSLAEWRAARL